MTSAESITVGSTGFGVGVGFAFQSGGGGGRSFVPCARAAGTDRKMASPPRRNTGHNLFSAPEFIIDTLESLIMPPMCWLTCSLSYRFSDGMIHDSLVRRQRRGVAHIEN